MFTILPEFEKQYLKYLELGKEFLRSKKLNIVGLARNVSDSLYDNIKSIENIRNYSKDINYFIYENDSIDSTPLILDQLSKDIKNFYYQSDKLKLKAFTHTDADTKLQLKSVERTTNLSNHRNRCLKYIKQYLSDSDFTIIIDLDFKQFSLDGIINSFGWLSENFADTIVGNSFEFKAFINPNQKNLWNYDCWAYRGTWWEDLQKYSNRYEIDPMAWFGFWQPPIGSIPIEVNSAFGGIGIYKTNQLIQVEYEGYDCEHVCLHKNLKNKFQSHKLCINPSQIMLF